MTNPPTHAQEGVADAFARLSEETAALVRREIDAAKQETWQRAKAAAPAAGMLGAAGLLGIYAAAAAYRISLRLLERYLPAPAGALVATVLYGGGAAAAALAGLRRLKNAPAPLPIDTARRTGHAASALMDR